MGRLIKLIYFPNPETTHRLTGVCVCGRGLLMSAGRCRDIRRHAHRCSDAREWHTGVRSAVRLRGRWSIPQQTALIDNLAEPGIFGEEFCDCIAVALCDDTPPTDSKELATA